MSGNDKTDEYMHTEEADQRVNLNSNASAKWVLIQHFR